MHALSPICSMIHTARYSPDSIHSTVTPPKRVRSRNYFFVFLFAMLFSLLTLPLLVFFGGPLPSFLASPVLRTLSRCLFCRGTPCLASAILAFFLATLRATRSTSVALTRLRSSLVSLTSFSPRDGSPFGIGGTGALLDVFCTGLEGETFLIEVGPDLHRWTRSFRFANLSSPGSSARISSTQVRS